MLPQLTFTGTRYGGRSRELDPEKAAVYEAKRKETITEVLKEFTSGDRGEVPVLRVGDGE